MLGVLIQALTDEADEDPATGREVYPLGVFGVFAAALFLAVFGVLGSL